MKSWGIPSKTVENKTEWFCRQMTLTVKKKKINKIFIANLERSLKQQNWTQNSSDDDFVWKILINFICWSLLKQKIFLAMLFYRDKEMIANYFYRSLVHMKVMACGLQFLLDIKQTTNKSTFKSENRWFLFSSRWNVYCTAIKWGEITACRASNELKF